MTEELKPCPLCLSTDLRLRDVAGWELDCAGCELSLVLADDPSRAGLVARWNLRPGTEWQPIETAPKTGEEILLGHANSVWADEWWGNSFWLQCATDGTHAGEVPTHWQSMPDPPKEVQ